MTIPWQSGFAFRPGQVASWGYSVGEATFAINSSPSQKDYLQFSVMQAGEAQRRCTRFLRVTR
jgi:hypothetical protein